jgi:uncharacterized protein
MTVIGVIGDSHIPARLKNLPESLEEGLQGIDLLLHTGDISRGWVLRKLEAIAPVVAVRGNNDYLVPFLPLRKDLHIEGLHLTLTHSHGGLAGYLFERYIYYTRGYTHQFHYKRVLASYPGSHMIVFGHTHMPYCQVRQGVLLFNPGSLSPLFYPRGSGPKFGKLTIQDGRVTAQAFDLASGAVLCSGEIRFQPAEENRDSSMSYRMTLVPPPAGRRRG